MFGSVVLLLCGFAVVSAIPQPDSRWPDQPEWWPLPWPPVIPEERPEWWPDCAAWPPALPEQFPPNCWPEQWPDEPHWWPGWLPWPPAVPEQWPEQPEWWPDNVIPWPPTHPEEIVWPLPGVDPDQVPYIPYRDNQFHLFTRENPSMSQPLLIENNNLLDNSNYKASRRTVVLVHDIWGSATSPFIGTVVPAFLSAADVNIIVLDWSAGADFNAYISTFYAFISGNFSARFIEWLTNRTGADLEDFHIVGLGLGALKSGFISRRLNSEVGYVTALDPSQGPSITTIIPPITPHVSRYTEVIHTDIGNRGYTQPLGDVDFYPNGGSYMPGCGGETECSRNRAVYYFAESILTGGFTGIECRNIRYALTSSCDLPGRLNLGGLLPKTGSSGVYWVGVNAAPPFSQG